MNDKPNLHMCIKSKNQHTHLLPDGCRVLGLVCQEKAPPLVKKKSKQSRKSAAPHCAVRVGTQDAYKSHRQRGRRGGH